MKYLPVKLNMWEHPRNYFGEVWPDYYVFLSQTRDSDALTRSNFVCGLARVKEKGGVAIAYERHWACGWIETILIHQDDYEVLLEADKIMQKLEDYPVVDEDHYSQLEYEEEQEYNELQGN